jgi:PelA/Pel-15E family pectate lyase
MAMVLAAVIGLVVAVAEGRAELVDEAREAMRRAIAFYHKQASVEGGYSWQYSGDLSLSEGEEQTDRQSIWIEPPGTPAVGAAMLEAYLRTGEPTALEAARDVGQALVRTQLHSGGWDAVGVFDEVRRSKIAYRVDGPWKPRTFNRSTLDDNKTQSAARFLMRLDAALEFKNGLIHQAARSALDALVAVQFASGGWPQRFDETHDPAAYPLLRASIPQAWPRAHPGGAYWKHATFNDQTIVDTIDLMLDAADVYGESRYRESAMAGGRYIVMSQLPHPQPGWAQQYDQRNQPTWARRFEPPAICTGESQNCIAMLMTLYERTGDKQWLEPIPAALAYLKKFEQPGRRLPFFIELGTDKPLYFDRQYRMTYDDSDLPTHYRFVIGSHLGHHEKRYAKLLAEGPGEGVGKPVPYPPPNRSVDVKEVRRIIDALDERGAWVETGSMGTQDWKGPVIQSKTFITNLDKLSRFIVAPK